MPAAVGSFFSFHREGIDRRSLLSAPGSARAARKPSSHRQWLHGNGRTVMYGTAMDGAPLTSVDEES